ncbi:MAG: HD domain-containing protein [Bacillota bacterium]|nr:HD domain-containing protein [Bacillota bacterium]
MTICFANYLGFSGMNLEDIGIAALLHDVGKMFIPDKILKKPGPPGHQRKSNYGNSYPEGSPVYWLPKKYSQINHYRRPGTPHQV